MSSAISTEGLDLDTLVYMAKAAGQAGRYDEMLQYMKAAAKSGKYLNFEQRNLLSVACENIIGPRRASWKTVSSIENKEVARGNTVWAEHMKEYRANIESELQSICNDVVTMLEENLLPKAEEPESKVFCYKLCERIAPLEGDYYRFLAECLKDEPRQIAATASEESYNVATKLAREKMASTHPLRLGLALNFSGFYYEIANSPERACQLAKEAFGEAISEVDNLNEENYRDSTHLMRLLRDNTLRYIVLVACGNTSNLSETLWTSGLNDEANPDEGAAAAFASVLDAEEQAAGTVMED